MTDKELTVLVILDPIEDDEPIVRVFDSQEEADEFLDRVIEYIKKKEQLESKETTVEVHKKTCTMGGNDLELIKKYIDMHSFDVVGIPDEEIEEYEMKIEDEIY